MHLKCKCCISIFSAHGNKVWLSLRHFLNVYLWAAHLSVIPFSIQEFTVTSHRWTIVKVTCPAWWHQTPLTAHMLNKKLLSPRSLLSLGRTMSLLCEWQECPPPLLLRPSYWHIPPHWAAQRPPVLLHEFWSTCSSYRRNMVHWTHQWEQDTWTTIVENNHLLPLFTSQPR